MSEQQEGARGAWRLAAIEVEALACAPCKRLGDDLKRHTTCRRLLRLARKFRGRAAPSETARGPESNLAVET
jgi:hypothetical protein